MARRKIPPYCQDGAEPDRYGLFDTLRNMWIEAEPTIKIGREERPRTFAALADHLGVPKQNVTQWATGSGGKAPAPWWYIMRLCHELGLGISITPEKCSLYRPS